MSIKQKLYIYAGLIALLIVVLIIWGALAFYDKTDTAAFIAQLGGLVTIIIGALGAVGGFHSGQAGASPGTDPIVSAGPRTLGAYQTDPIRPMYHNPTGTPLTGARPASADPAEPPPTATPAQ